MPETVGASGRGVPTQIPGYRDPAILEFLDRVQERHPLAGRQSEMDMTGAAEPLQGLRIEQMLFEEAVGAGVSQKTAILARGGGHRESGYRA